MLENLKSLKIEKFRKLIGAFGFDNIHHKENRASSHAEKGGK